MVTTTDDLSERMTAVETGLVELRGEMQANQRETNARFTAVETGISELRADQRAMTARIDTLQQSVNSRIDRLFYAIVGGSAAMVIATVSALMTLVLTLD